MLKFALLGSGSSGNATLVTDGRSSVLIDNGLSYVRLADRLEKAGLSVGDLDAVFVTHEHADHAKGLGVLSRKADLPIYASRGTCGGLSKGLGVVRRLEAFEAGDEIRVGALTVSSFSVAHDACDPVNYTVSNTRAKIGFATDFGHCSHLIRTRLSGSHALVMESNYCPDMLRNGTYPPSIRQRISGRLGHLSNHDAAALMSALAHDGLQLVVLVHLSQENNQPELAYRLAREALGSHPAEIVVAPPDGDARIFEVCPQ